MPKISVSELPEAATAWAQRRRLSSRARSMRRMSAISWRAIALRSMSTSPAGLIVANSRVARSGGELAGCAARVQLAQQSVQPVDGAAALGGQLVAAIGEQPQHGAVVIGADAGEVVAVLGDDRDAARVDAVALASVAAVQHADLGGQRRRDVDHGLAGGDELLGQQAPEPAGTLDRPDALRPARRPGEQPGECRAVREQRSSPSDSPPASSATAVCELLWGSMPMVTMAGAP